ncbi:Leucine Rich Repeat [Seminavis robusta]|uniref:Leucine Rich Repeat n=1 Tax=Seminavis robusta TaxID=568900 RepID=A0A9N8DIN0_9STRA|nr:Leucine Rich Repeat [Seminavis robusta]|eukprot:Sro106_g053470.1 Leucine Rich Repeat (716) ;mRNA; f:25300-27528
MATKSSKTILSDRKEVAHSKDVVSGSDAIATVVGGTKNSTEGDRMATDIVVSGGEKKKAIGKVENNTESPLRQAMNVAASTDDFDPLSSVLPMPLPTADNNQNQQPAMVRPGAYAVAPGIYFQRATFLSHSLVVGVRSEEFRRGGSDEEQPAGNSEGRAVGLAVANPVSEIFPYQLPQAFNFDDSKQAVMKRMHNSKQIKTFLLLVSIALTAFGMVVLAVLIPGNSTAATTTAPSTTQVPAITAAPISNKGFLDSLLNNCTIQGQEDHGSPQFKAYQWLMEDSDNLPFYTIHRIKQKFALATVFYSTGGSTWDDNTNWLNHSVHECDWFRAPDFGRKSRVTKFYPGYLEGFLEPLPTTVCNNDGLYQHLWLDQNNLVGSLPEELYMLTSLRTVSCGWNQLEGTISSHIGQLTSLEGLYLQNLHLTGTLPTAVGLLSGLQVFSLSTNQIEGSIPSEVWQLTKLRDVSLRRLKLKGTLPSEIAALSRLRYFLLAESDFSGTIPSELGLLESLKALGLYSNQFSGSLPSELGQLTVLSGFRFWGNYLEGTLPTELGLATSLINIHGGQNQFSGQIPSEFGMLTYLEAILSFHDNSLTQTIPTELGLLTRLQELQIQDNEISGWIPSEIGKLTSLEHMALANNSLSGTLPEELSILKQSLHTLSLTGNPLLSGSVPATLCALNGTCDGNNFGFEPCREAGGLSFDCTDILCGCECYCPK